MKHRDRERTKGEQPAISHGSEVPIFSRPLFELFEQSRSRYGSNLWLSETDKKLTFDQSEKLIVEISEGLAGLGIFKGDRVALCLPNNIAYPLFTFACWRLGVVVVGLTALYAAPMLRILIEDSRPKIIITMDDEDLRPKIEKAAGPGTKILLLSTNLKELLQTGDADISDDKEAFRYQDFIAGKLPVEPAEIDLKNDLALLQFTGGTTGKPKGTMLSHYNVVNCVEAFLNTLPNVRHGAEKFIAIGPFSHRLGTTLIMAVATALGAEIAIPKRFHPEETTEYILREKITMLFGVPTMFQAMAMAECAAEGDWSNVTYGLCGGAPLPRAIRDSFQSVTGVNLLQGYGLSETSSGVTFTPPERENPEGTIGFPIPNTRVEIRDQKDPSKTLLRNEVGEICVNGPQVMSGYWELPDATGEVMLGDLFRTGDTGYIDEDGAVFIVDRIKDIIIASGFNVYPRLVENAIYTHPAIAEVAVIGEPHDYRGESVKAVVSLVSGQSLTLGQLQEYLHDKLSPIEIPKALEILDVLPKTPVGKIDKTQLR